MAAMTDYLENLLVDGLFRGTNTPALATWAATTAYVVGDVVVPHASMTAAGGKFLRCTTAGTTGSTNTLAIPAVGSTLVDGTVTWTAVSGIPCYTQYYMSLFTVTPSDTGGGTEVTGNGYQRVLINTSLTSWAGTQAVASTTASTGNTGTTSNNAQITFPAPSGGNWGTVVAFGIHDKLTGGNLLFWGALNNNKTVNNGDAAPYFAVSQLSFQIDN
jgi:hypothetical protein